MKDPDHEIKTLLATWDMDERRGLPHPMKRVADQVPDMKPAPESARNPYAFTGIIDRSAQDESE
jgi:hypothetical protein